jgi:putative zinc finger/helix-turn-helix YgiT family protein
MTRQRKCATCRKGIMNPVTLDYSVEMEHDGRAYMLRVPNLEVLLCDQCQSNVLPDASYERLADALRREAGLLIPSEIIEERTALGLNQKDFAHLLGVAPETVSRWETGGQIQQRVMNDFMQAFFDLPELRNYLKRKRGLAPAKRSRSPVNWEDTDTSEAGEVQLISTLNHSATPLEFVSPFLDYHSTIMVR